MDNLKNVGLGRVAIVYGMLVKEHSKVAKLKEVLPDIVKLRVNPNMVTSNELKEMRKLTKGIVTDKTLTHAFKVFGINYGYNQVDEISSVKDKLTNLLDYAYIYVLLHNKKSILDYTTLVNTIKEYHITEKCTKFHIGGKIYETPDDLETYMSHVYSLMFPMSYMVKIYIDKKMVKSFYTHDKVFIGVELGKVCEELGVPYNKPIYKLIKHLDTDTYTDEWKGHKLKIVVKG